MTGHNDKIFFCTAHYGIRIWIVLEIKLAFWNQIQSKFLLFNLKKLMLA